MPRNMLGGAGGTVRTTQNQGGGNKKAGKPTLVGRNVFNRNAIINRAQGTCLVLCNRNNYNFS
tara:strand:- start:627 stop:815 length:189 start_codon:yes stop_codon:yes gene_type:complete